MQSSITHDRLNETQFCNYPDPERRSALICLNTVLTSTTCLPV